MRTALIALCVLVSCKGGDDEGDDDIVPDGEGDADTDTDADGDTDTDDTDVPETGPCAPLADVGGTTVGVDDDLAAAVAAATAGDTLLLAVGTHDVVGPIVVDKALTIRGESDDRTATVVDGGDTGGHLFEVVASDVTFAHLTLTRSYDDTVHAAPVGADIARLTVHDVAIVDSGRFGLVVGDNDGPWVDAGVVSCSRFELSNAHRPFVRNGCDTGGIDAYGARDWVVRDNVLASFWCTSALSGPAIRFWRGSRNTLIEKNTVLDAPYGIVLGETQDSIGRVYADVSHCEPGALQHIDGTVRNNIVSVYDDDLIVSASGAKIGIAVHSSCEATVVHNSVQSDLEPSDASIQIRYDTTTGTIANNLLSYDLIVLDGADIDAPVGTNMENVEDNTWFFPAMDNFHTAPASPAVNAGIAIESVTDDIDGEPRDDGMPDIGADEI